MTYSDEPNPPRNDLPWGRVNVEPNIDAWEVVVTFAIDGKEMGLRLELEDLFDLRSDVRDTIRAFEDVSLNSCPFCGGDHANFFRLESRGTKVVCSDCAGSTKWCGSIGEAMSAWNRRTRDATR